MNAALAFLDHNAEAATLRALVEEKAIEVQRDHDPVEAERHFEIFLRAIYPREAFEWKPRREHL